MSLLDKLDNPLIWQQFLDYKQEKGHLSRSEESALKELVASKAYLGVARALQAGEPLPPPQKLRLNKLGTQRKRIVYAFEPDTMWVLKLLAWLLFCFDERQPPGCYSFRRDHGVHRALNTIIRTPRINTSWCCKLDISDYFNSIDIPRLLPILGGVLADDPRLLAFFEQFLTAGVALDEGVLIHEEHGVMAGTPTAPFLANLYLRELDLWFNQRGLTYARYSDDIIFFAPDEDVLSASRRSAEAIIARHGLVINSEKASVAAPGMPWEFLGISYCDGTIDLSQVTRRKIKGKIRRKARALRRWMLRKQAEDIMDTIEPSPLSLSQRAIRAYIRSFNKKFYDSFASNELTWARWFFPLLTTSEGLREIDHYLQQYARWIPTGRFQAGNYRTSYQDLKALGFKSLVHEYYSYQAGIRAQEQEKQLSSTAV